MDAWLTHRSVRDLRPGDLAWLAFAGEEEQGHIIGPFIGGGLDGEDTVIYVTDAGPGELPGPAGPARADHVESGRLRLIPWRRAALRDGHFDSTRTAVAASTMITAICQIDRHNVTEAELDALRGAHEVAVRPNPEFEDPVLRITRTFHPRGLAIAGEIDAARHAVFAEALAAAASGAAGVSAASRTSGASAASVTCEADEIHLDCAELRFMDLGALHLLAGYASDRAGRGLLVLDRVPRHLRTVIELVGWGRLPGVRLGDVVP